jgi:hypothetical protein
VIDDTTNESRVQFYPSAFTAPLPPISEID